MSSFIIFCYMNGNRCITRTRILKYGLKYQAPGTGLKFPAHLIRCHVRALSTLARPNACGFKQTSHLAATHGSNVRRRQSPRQPA